jgi:hypothetical protein
MSGPVYDDPISAYRRPTTPAPVCTVCGSHINPDYGTGPVCGACLIEREDTLRGKNNVCAVCGGPLGSSVYRFGGISYCSAKCVDKALGHKVPADTEPSPLRESLDDIAGGLVDTLIRKNTDYGDSYRRLRDEFGPDSFLIRLGDKYNRLIALRGKDALVSESTDDTIRDIAGYCLLEMAYRKEAE